LSTRAAVDSSRPPGVAALSVPSPGVNALVTIGLAAILCAIAFAADGGLQIGRTTPTEIALLLAGGLAVSGAVLLAPRPEHLWGCGPLALLVALAVLTAASITWAAQPADAWLEANRTLAYVAVFAAAVALAHAVPGRWSAVLGGITLAAVAISAYALLTKILPGALNPDEIYARLREPFGYWNSVGLMAALGVPGCLWLGARRSGHQGLNALAYPAFALLVLTMLMAYSRGALLAAGLGAACWFATVPLRLRGAAVLLVGGAGAGLVAAWAFSQSALTDDRVPLDLRNQAGLQLGLALVVVLGLVLAAGLALNFTTTAAAAPVSARASRCSSRSRSCRSAPSAGSRCPTRASVGRSRATGTRSQIPTRRSRSTIPAASRPPAACARATGTRRCGSSATTSRSGWARAATRPCASATAPPTRRSARPTATSSRRSPTSASPALP
jgi:hypothetical protein